MLPDIIAERPNGGFLLVGARVRDVLWQYRQDGQKQEAGGVLLGSYRGDHIDVIDATLPGLNDYRSRTGFVRRDQSHQNIAEKHWIQSGGAITYIGEWHTHPEALPIPSVIDVREWKNKLPRRGMVLCIQGTEGMSLHYLFMEHKVLRLQRLEFEEVLPSKVAFFS
ncbi:MAG: Mov34/MPN/PAD-1 family protein [Candidatus Reddybacter sp.]